MDLSELREAGIDRPYPGLRPFQPGEAPIFFGRGRQLRQMIERLEENGFLAVVGSSGSGKSSLVRAGLLPAIQEGYISSGDASWEILTIRPSGDPYGNLAREIAGRAGSEDRGSVPFLEVTLRGGPEGFADALEEAGLGSETPVLILVDQFEEIFRFPGIDDSGFVSRMLKAAESEKRTIYVIITMRSDFIGQCDIFSGLPEWISESQFLTPRLTRGELREAITGPAGLFGAEIEENLVNQILNDAGNEFDQLPLMQHALMRTWMIAGTVAAGDGGFQSPKILKIEHYEAAGRQQDALKDHAEEAWTELKTPRQQRIAENLFRLLSERRDDGLATRRFTSVAEVAAAAGAEAFEVIEVVDVFRRDHRDFLVVSPEGEMTGASRIDISHEALMRQWDRLHAWIQAESASAKAYSDLVTRARKWRREGSAWLWDGFRRPEFAPALRWLYSGVFEVERILPFVFDYRTVGEFPVTFVALQKLLDRIPLVVRAALQSLLIFTRPLTALRGARYIWTPKKCPATAARREWARRYEKNPEDFSDAIDFLTASIRKAYLRNLGLIVAVYAAMIVLILFGIYQTKTKRAIERLQATSQTDLGIARVENGRKREAVTLFSRALDFERSEAASESLRRLIANQSDDFPPMMHAESVTSAEFSPDGKRIVTASEDGTARIWDAVTGAPIGVAMEHKGAVNSAEFSSDGKWVVTASGDRYVRIWNAGTGKPAGEPLDEPARYLLNGNLLDGHYSVTAPHFNEPGTAIVLVFNRAVDPFSEEPKGSGAVVWEIGKDGTIGQPVFLEDNYPGTTNSAVFSQDGKRVVTTKNSSAVIWDAETGSAIGRPLRHNGSVNSGEFSPDGARVVTASDDRTARIWMVDTANSADDSPGFWIQESFILPHEGLVRLARFSPDGKWVITASDKTARIWNAENGEVAIDGMKHDREVVSVEFSSDGSLVLTVSEDSSAWIWKRNAGSKSVEKLGEIHDPSMHSARFSPDGTRVVTANHNGSARVWNLKRTVQVEHGSYLTEMNFNLEGNRFVIVDGSKVARIWDARTGKLAAALEHDGTVLSAEFSPDGRSVVTSGKDGTARIWKVDTEMPEPIILAHEGPVNSARFSPDGKRVATASAEVGREGYVYGVVRIWDAATGNPLMPPLNDFSGTLEVRFSPDGKQLATANAENAVRIWEVENQDDHGRVTMIDGTINSVAFSSDGKRLLVASEDESAALIDTEILLNDSPQSGAVFLNHDNFVTDAIFGPDGTWVVTACRDGTVRFWNTETGAQIGQPLYHDFPVEDIELSRDGKKLATASGSTKIWDVELRAPIWSPQFTEAVADLVRFSPDGTRLASAGLFGDTKISTLPPPAKNDREWLRLSVEVRSNFVFDEETLRVRPLSIEEWWERRRKIDREYGGKFCDRPEWSPSKKETDLATP